MKEGWTYKKLGEVCEALNGLWVGKKEPFVNVAVIRNTNFSKDCKLKLDDVAYIDVEEKQFATRKLQVGDIIIEKSGGSDKQPVGRPILFNIPNGNYSFSNFTSVLRLTDKNIFPRFLHYCLYGYYRNGETKKIQSKTTGLRNLDMKAYLRLAIPYPEIAEQERIVAELDLLSGIIEKKKEQLNAYDQLAQSIFYTMFGDPITNEKGWEVKKLGEVYKLKSGDGLSAKQFVDGQYPVYGGNGISGMHNSYNMDGNFIIIGRVGVYCGNVRNVIGKFWLTDNAFQLYYDESKQNPSFVTYLLTSLNLHQYANQAAQPVISNVTLKDVIIIFPPLSLQQEFAEKIEAIERQKTIVQQSIAETETLFNSRMDYYFG